MIVADSLGKQYRLGGISGTTLREALQSRRALRKGLEDPNRPVGEKKKNGTFWALRDISFEVGRGEALGIIGHNGAGKSTLLKLLCQVTGPTTGTIALDGRIASMLEVGTGFHPELTGRENIFMNGAILGMRRSEIERKLEDIIEFSEVREFIDTPVKRYSSGMYVKLAFSVAAHLDSEIMIMDEVLAVGDMAFQNKCIQKMRSAAEGGRTVLYVSHNMSTIRQLCQRCLVLDHGRIVYDGETEDAIREYMGASLQAAGGRILVTPRMRDPEFPDPEVRITEAEGLGGSSQSMGEKKDFALVMENRGERERKVTLRVLVKTYDGMPVSMVSTREGIRLAPGEKREKRYRLDTSHLVPGKYALSLVLYEVGEQGMALNLDVLRDIFFVTVLPDPAFNHGMAWNSQWWGHVSLGDLMELEG